MAKSFINKIFEPLGYEVIIRESDGYLHATSICKQAGKSLDHWLDNTSTQKYLESLRRFLIPQNSGELEMLETKKGKYGGTWIHPCLVVEFARWIDFEFSIWANQKVQEVLNGMTEEQCWTKERLLTKMRCKDHNRAMSEMIEEAPEDLNLKKWGHSNDHCMLNRVLVGKWGKCGRDALDQDTLKLLQYLERLDTELIVQRKDLKARELELQAAKDYFLSLDPKKQQTLI